MSAHILGVGIGLFFLLILWTFVLITCIISVRSQNNFCTILTTFAVIITIFLIYFPKGSEDSQIDTSEVFDHLFIWRNLVLLFVVIGAIVGGVVLLFEHFLQPFELRIKL